MRSIVRHLLFVAGTTWSVACGVPGTRQSSPSPHVIGDASSDADTVFAPEAGSESVVREERDAAATSSSRSSDSLDASVPSVDVDAVGIAWPNADACVFPPVSPGEGRTANQCCNPAPAVTVCLETRSLIHHHTVGPYTQRTLTVSHVSNVQARWSFPLDRQSHGSMARPDVVMARLSFRVHRAGLELRVRGGCRNVCTAETCGKEQKLLASICAAAGQYRWDGEGLVRE